MPKSQSEHLTVASYGTKPCTVCHAPIIDLPDAPPTCGRHDLEKRESQGPLRQIGVEQGYTATRVERVGLFAAVVPRYVRDDRPILGRDHYKTWIDPETGKRMGRNLGASRV